MSNNEINKDGLIRSVLIIFVGIILLSLVYNMFFQTGPNVMGSYGSAGVMGDMHGGMVGAGVTPGFGGFSLSSLLAGILVLFIKILSILLVVGLLAGMVMVLKKYLMSTGDRTWLFATLEQKNCQSCGRTIKGDWDYCSHCGNSLQNKPPETK